MSIQGAGVAEPRTPSVESRFTGKVELMETLVRTPGADLTGVPLGPVALRRWAGDVRVGGAEFQVYKWASPNVYSDPANVDLRRRFEAVVKTIKKMHGSASEKELIRALSMQNAELLTLGRELKNDLARTTHLLSLRDAELARLKRDLGKVVKLAR